MVRNSLGKYLEEKESELIEKHNLKEDIQDKNYQKRGKAVYEGYQVFLQNIKALDPACGSGAFYDGVVLVLFKIDVVPWLGKFLYLLLISAIYDNLDYMYYRLRTRYLR